LISATFQPNQSMYDFKLQLVGLFYTTFICFLVLRIYFASFSRIHTCTLVNTHRLLLWTRRNSDYSDIHNHMAFALSSPSSHGASSGGMSPRTSTTPESVLLHACAHEHYVDIINTLLKNGVSIECQDDEGRTPLLVAAYCL
jgi:ankyrin repeat protein